MRQKSDEKRQQILHVASKLFLEFGLESVSMSQIAAKVGGSKATLYNYFQNKEDLFVEVALNVVRQGVEKSSVRIDSTLPFFEKLRILCSEFLIFMLSEDCIALYRNVLGYPHHGKIGKEAFEEAIHTAWGHVVSLIEEAMDEGVLKRADSWFAVTQLRSLIELDLVHRRLLRLDDRIEADEIARNVDVGLAVFKSYYGV